MSPIFAYQSDLFDAVPENSGYLAIYISESRCDIAICSSSFVLLFFESFKRVKETRQVDFIKQVFSSKQSLFAKHFQSVNVGIQHTCFSIIPQQMELDGQKFLTDLCGEFLGDVFEENVPFLNASLTYSIDSELSQVISQTFERHKISHGMNLGLELARTAAKYDQLLIIDDDYFDLIVKKDQHIYSANRHKYEALEDVTYFALLGAKDAEIEPHDTKLLITGLCDRSSEIYTNLSEFVGQVEVKKINELVNIRSDFDQPQQYAEYALNLLHANY